MKIIFKICNGLVWCFNQIMPRTPNGKNTWGRIDNMDFFSIDFLVSSLEQEPNMTLKELIDMSKAFKACGCGEKKNGFTVIQGDNYREGTQEDIEEMQRDINREVIKAELEKRNN